MRGVADIEAARERIRGGIYVSPGIESIPPSKLAGAYIYCKPDYLQHSGTFNERVIAGQGTIALEILVQTPDLQAIVAPVGR